MTTLPIVSPKTGRAVSRASGEPYRERLLRLPPFLLSAGPGSAPDARDLTDAFRLTGYFLERHVFEPRGLAAPDGRARLLRLVNASGAAAA